MTKLTRPDGDLLLSLNQTGRLNCFCHICTLVIFLYSDATCFSTSVACAKALRFPRIMIWLCERQKEHRKSATFRRCFITGVLFLVRRHFPEMRSPIVSRQAKEPFKKRLHEQMCKPKSSNRIGR